MYGIFTNIYPKNHPNVGKYSIHGSYGLIVTHPNSSEFIVRNFSQEEFRDLFESLHRTQIFGSQSHGCRFCLQNPQKTPATASDSMKVLRTEVRKVQLPSGCPIYTRCLWRHRDGTHRPCTEDLARLSRQAEQVCALVHLQIFLQFVLQIFLDSSLF